jgi:hypothetical protein
MQLVANLDRKFTNLMDPVALIGGAANSYQCDGASWQRVGNSKQLALACGNTTLISIDGGRGRCLVMGCKATRGISKPLGPVSSDIIRLAIERAARTMAVIGRYSAHNCGPKAGFAYGFPQRLPLLTRSHPHMYMPVLIQ